MYSNIIPAPKGIWLSFKNNTDVFLLPVVAFGERKGFNKWFPLVIEDGELVGHMEVDGEFIGLIYGKEFEPPDALSAEVEGIFINDEAIQEFIIK
jgi:hypothetical protein